jgi:hypothetical protein
LVAKPAALLYGHHIAAITFDVPASPSSRGVARTARQRLETRTLPGYINLPALRTPLAEPWQSGQRGMQE